MLFFSIVTFIITLQSNIQHFLVNRVSEPLVRSKMAITLELRLSVCQISAGVYKDKEKVIKVQILLKFSPVQLTYFKYPIFDRFSPILKTRVTF